MRLWRYQGVLIVPSGIETQISGGHCGSVIVLIVPSGIETKHFGTGGEHPAGINCT